MMLPQFVAQQQCIADGKQRAWAVLILAQDWHRAAIKLYRLDQVARHTASGAWW